MRAPGHRFNVAGCFGLYLALASLAVGQPIEVIPSDLRGATQPQVAVAPDGRIFVTFGKGSSVFCSVSTNGGKTFLHPVEVANLPGLMLGMRRGPRIVASDQHVTISAISRSDGNLYSWTSADSGVTWSKAAMLNSVSEAAREGLHGMASDGRGKVFSVWLDLRNKGTQLWGAASRDGGRSWEKDTMIYQSPDGHVCECCHPSAAILPDGSIRVMWRNWLGGSRDMYVAISSDGGKTFGMAEKLGTGTWLLNGCPMDGGSLAGRYTTWRRDSSIYYTDGTGGEHLLDTDGRQPVVGIGDRGACFVWQQGPRLMVKKGALERVVLAEQGAYPVLAGVTNVRGPIVVWESTTNGVQTIFAEVLN